SSRLVRSVPNGCNWAQPGATFLLSRDKRSGISRCTNRLTAKLEGRRDGALGVLLNRPQMVLVPETLGVDLVDVFGARWPRGKPSRLGFDLDAAEGLIVTRRTGPNRTYRFAGKLPHIELLRPERLQRALLFRRRRHIDSLVIGHTEFGREGGKQLAWVAAGSAEDFGGEQPHHHAVLVGRPDRSVALEERCAGAFLAGESERTAAETIDEPFEADRGFDQLALQLLCDTVDDRAGDDGLADRRFPAPLRPMLEQIGDRSREKMV